MSRRELLPSDCSRQSCSLRLLPLRSGKLELLVMQNPSTKTAGGKNNFRTPDIAVGTYEIFGLPDNSAVFPEGANPPLLVVEITNNNRKHDLEDKVEEYLATGIPEHVIIDRDEPHNGKDAAVHVLKLRIDKYVRKCFKGNEMVECSFVESVTAAELLDPSEATFASVQNKLREEAELQNEVVKRQQAEAGLREEQAMRREARAKKKEYKQVLKGMGVLVSPSSSNSSSTNSPVTKISSRVDASVKKSSSRVNSPGQKNSSAVNSPVKKRARWGSGGVSEKVGTWYDYNP